jgi:SAM-dependent methyltransferase
MSLDASPAGWYRSSFAENFHSLYWEEGSEEMVDLALEMLAPADGERFLDLACGTGRRTMALCRRGYQVLGSDIRGGLLEVAGVEARDNGLWPYFYEEDPRYLEFDREFDFVLSLGAGAFGHFESDEEDLNAFRCAATALNPDGRLLMQAPNLAHVEAHLHERTWVIGSRAVDVIEQRWDAAIRRIDGVREQLLCEEDLKGAEPVPFQRRVYSIEELSEIFEGVGLGLSNVFDEQGEPCAPDDTQREIFVEAVRV